MAERRNSTNGDRSSLQATCLAAALMRYGDADVVEIISVETPVPSPKQVLVRTEAAGVNPFDRELRRGNLTDFFPVEFPHVMGLEFAGVAVEVGADVTSVRVGDRVMGELRQAQGAFSQFVAVDEAKLCLTPPSLSALQVAAIPSVALTAWGGLHALSDLTAGMKVLVHGASGNVGNYAVQFAAAAGAEVYGTASAKNADYVLDRGAKRVFDRHTEHPDDSLSELDLIFDAVGDPSVDRLWSLLAPKGVLVSVADPNIADRAPAGVKAGWYKMEFERDRLQTIALDVAAGRLKLSIARVLPFDDLPKAIELCGTGHAPGKIVIAIP